MSSMSKMSMQHYVLSRQWSSDIEFFKIETSFLHHLLDDYFNSLISISYISDLKINGDRLLNLEKAELKVSVLINRQLKETEWIARNLIKENKERIADAHVEIEYQMVNIAREFHALKSNIFNLIQKVIHRERVILNGDSL